MGSKMELKFKRDTQFRKQFFAPDSFAHPAKMDSQLLLWIVETYTKAGETILDPMAGSGTTTLACTLGRNVILVELEDKFVRMCIHNRVEVRMKPQLGYSMGECPVLWGDARNIKGAREHTYEDLWLKYPKFDYPTIKSMRRHYNLLLKSDARQLEGLLVDKCIFSPPYAEALDRDEHKVQNGRVSAMMDYSYLHSKQGRTKGQIGNLIYGNIDSIITSPPYEESLRRQSGDTQNKLMKDKGLRQMPQEVDSIITSPPYENQGQGQGKEYHPERMAGSETGLGRGYGDELANIGNLKSDSYLEAMLQVYQSCFAVLKSGGLMILVTKNFIRNKQVIRLDLDTIKLCEQAGFNLLERHYRKLPAQSFWRVIYHQKFPDVEQINNEDILVFSRSI